MVRFNFIDYEGNNKYFERDLEKILKEWWTNDGMLLPAGDVVIVNREYYINETKFKADTFEQIITELNIQFWANKENTKERY